MKFILFFLLFIVSVQSILDIPNTHGMDKHQAQYMSCSAKNDFRIGANIPWDDYGWDFHSHYLWGNHFDPSFWETSFSNIKQAGGSLVRFWVFADGRAAPVFDTARNFIYLDLEFYTQFDTVLEIARKVDIQVIPVLWNHDALDDMTTCCGMFAGSHQDIFLRPKKYFDNVLIPLVSRYNGSSQIYAWELMNEPEFAMIGTGNHYMKHSIPADQMIKFFIESTSIIHTYGASKVTVGAAHPDTLHWWRDETWRNHGASDADLLDIIQVHVYPWSKEFSWLLPASFRQPLLIGETPANSGRFKNVDNVVMAQRTGYAGLLYWSYSGSNSNLLGNWTSIHEKMTRFKMKA